MTPHPCRSFRPRAKARAGLLPGWQ